MIKKFGFALLCAFFLMNVCAVNGGAALARQGKLKVVCTIFPAYDWVRCIAGEETADLTLLMDKGVDLHSYQPSVADVAKISDCDVFIYVGGESDGWVDGILKEKKNKDMVVINLLAALGDAVKEEEALEGMEEEHDDHDHEEEGPEYDEHVWLSLKNAAALCRHIAEQMSSADLDNAPRYRSAAAAYEARLKALDAQYAETVRTASLKTLLFGDRFPFRYLADDYGLNCYAAFPGCSAETEASFKTVVFLARKMDELRLPVVMTIDGSDGRIAETVIQNTAEKDQKVLTLNSMQSVTARDVTGGATYLSLMESNLETLKKALN